MKPLGGTSSGPRGAMGGCHASLWPLTQCRRQQQGGACLGYWTFLRQRHDSLVSRNHLVVVWVWWRIVRLSIAFGRSTCFGYLPTAHTVILCRWKSVSCSGYRHGRDKRSVQARVSLLDVTQRGLPNGSGPRPPWPLAGCGS